MTSSVTKMSYTKEPSEISGYKFVKPQGRPSGELIRAYCHYVMCGSELAGLVLPHSSCIVRIHERNRPVHVMYLSS